MRPPRHIKSFVLRAGRVTAAQERALTDLWPAYGLEFTGARIDLDAVFARPPAEPAAARAVAPADRVSRCLEIGFGAGEVIGSLAVANPQTDYLGIEVHRSGVGRLLLHAANSRVNNLRIVCHDAVDVLRMAIDDDAFDEVLVFFPDPWHKKRHHKRRLLDSEFVALLTDKLRESGLLRLATDWEDYAHQMLAVCSAEPRLDNVSVDGSYVPRPAVRPSTRYERRGVSLGHGVWDLAFRKRTG